MTPEEFRAAGHKVVDWIADYRARLDQLPVMARTAPGDVRRALPAHPPQLPESFDAILEDQSGYYLIGYRPTDETFNRRFHHIKAKVKRSGMTLRTRFGFFGVTEEEASRGRRTVRDLTNLALMSPFAAQDINLEITSFFANDKIAGSVIRSFVYIDPDDMSFTPYEITKAV